MSVLASSVSLAQSPFPPLAVGFMGLGTGYLIYGTQELLGYPKRDSSVDLGTGIWGRMRGTDVRVQVGMSIGLLNT
jgi:hypothetical protein